LGAAISFAAFGALSAQPAPSGGPDLRYTCEVEYFGQMNVAVWSKQGVCLREAQGKSRDVRCTVSNTNVTLTLVSGVEQIDRTTERFSGSVIVNQRPAPYKGVCKSLKPKPQG
jgi:hypothetical protein